MARRMSNSGSTQVRRAWAGSCQRAVALPGFEASASPVATGAATPAAGPATPAPGTPEQAELDRMILNAAILNGALELLPQSMASMAIIPLQVRLVYRIGKAHGFELDRGHIKDFLATTGVGMTGQYVEQFGRKLIGGLLGKVLGGAGRAIGSQATGSAFSFATTWAIGKVAVPDPITHCLREVVGCGVVLQQLRHQPCAGQPETEADEDARRQDQADEAAADCWGE